MQACESFQPMLCLILISMYARMSLINALWGECERNDDDLPPSPTHPSQSQLCINFVNEMLQEYFNENVFDAETALLTSLGLPEIEVQVADNGPRLRLLTTLFARLDDEAKNKHADDVTFLRNVGSVAEEKCVLSHPHAALISDTRSSRRKSLSLQLCPNPPPVPLSQMSKSSEHQSSIP